MHGQWGGEVDMMQGDGFRCVAHDSNTAQEEGVFEPAMRVCAALLVRAWEQLVKCRVVCCLVYLYKCAVLSDPSPLTLDPVPQATSVQGRQWTLHNAKVD